VAILEQTVTKNNVEAAEEIVRQLRLRDIGGIIVVDFIDMVLESNRDLVLRRLVECLGRDRTKHQVAEVTSLGLVQMTRKRIGSGLLESFSETCEVCSGRGIKVSLGHAHEPAPRSRRPAGAVDPAEVAARALAAREADDPVRDPADETAQDPAELPELPETESDQSLFASDD
jgi:Ribonucleases G and E